ncbi:MAG: hypothetical protein OXR07_03030 [Nitrospira sp.]|nr:hypothetical protein [Nitrospira sp.]MDD9859458.1 hypothetical protein [Nitrospira sp.]
MGTRLSTIPLFSLLAAGSLASVLVGIPSLHAAPIHGFGELKFGMPPAEVEALADCSSQTECLYDLLGKNRYFVLGYGPVNDTADQPTGATAYLSHIDIDMGAYTQEWFQELFELFSSQYAMSHYPTEQEDTSFRQSRSQELVIGFADGLVLLKVVRRPFGNLIIRMVYQDDDHAQVQRKLWSVAP